MSSRSRTDKPVTCRVCDTKNDHFYTYCRNCLQTLPSRPDSRRP
ncbi:DUF7577 domain-containing protein [Haloterrigena alkaliphila]